MAAWLFQNIVVKVLSGIVSSPTNIWSHMASFVACVAAIYCASIIDNVIIGCFFELQVMAPPPIRLQGMVSIRVSD